MRRESRIDRVTVRVDAIVTDARGYARIKGTIIAGAMLLEYGPADGHRDGHTELVPQETIEDAEALETMRFSPVTLHHPPEMLDSSNTARFQVGTVISADIADGALVTDNLFTDAGALGAIEGGTVELSAGYTAEIDETPGEFNGARYDAIQRNRRYNHVALVPRARAGGDSTLHLDSVRGALSAPGLRVQLREDDGQEMASLTIGDKTVEVPDEMAEALVRDLESTDGEENAADAGEDDEENEDAKAAADTEPPPASAGPATEGARGDSRGVTELLAAVGLVPSKLADELERRDAKRADASAETARIVTEAKAVLPASWRADGKSDCHVMREAILAVQPDLEAMVEPMRTDSAKLGVMFSTVLATRSDSAPSHALGDDVRSDAGDSSVDKQRLDAADNIFRRHRLIGREAMMHADMQAAGA